MGGRIVIFRDGFGNQIKPKGFYQEFPNIHTCDKMHYFSFGYLYGQRERVVFLSPDGYVIAEIDILNVSGSKAYD